MYVFIQQIDTVSERDEGFYLAAAVSTAGSVIHRVHLKVQMTFYIPIRITF